MHYLQIPIRIGIRRRLDDYFGWCNTTRGFNMTSLADAIQRLKTTARVRNTLKSQQNQD